ncbi:MAG: MarR family transcriptional regulator [Oscillospiraceae bacterium]|nr:MarR family transcriptional regulator [Oscillospiraceae bacterium]
MMVLWEHKTMNVKAMGDILYLDSGTMTPVLKKLESKRFITRRRSTADERNLVVTITEAGELLKEKAVAVPAEIAKCSNLEPEEAAMLYRILYKMLEKRTRNEKNAPVTFSQVRLCIFSCLLPEKNRIWTALLP